MLRFLALIALLGLSSSSWPLVRLGQASQGTALRSSWYWLIVAWAGWIMATAASLVGPSRNDAAWVGLLHLSAATLALGPMVAVLGARWPGERAWNLIVLTLLAIFSLPILEQALLGRALERSRVGMDMPRFAYFWVIALVGIVNYLPTRSCAPACLYALALSAQTMAVGPWEISSQLAEAASALAGILLSLAAWSALALRRVGPTGLCGMWLFLRDGWGMVWSLRVRDRWNASAQRYSWPIRLQWHGVVHRPELPRLTSTQQEAAEAEFRFLLRRFADPDRVRL